MTLRTRKKTVAVVTPIYTTEMSADDERSLRHLEEHLGAHDRYFIAPRGLHPRRSGFEIVHFPATCFRSVASYSRLLLSADFYRAFQDYEYILVYQLDCLVFSDDLLDWCQAGWDYIGAPWLANSDVPEEGFSRVGNGGLSLRRVESFLEVIEAGEHVQRRAALLRDLFCAPIPDLRRQLSPASLIKRLRVLREVRRGASWYLSHYSLNEDRFWSDRARLFVAGFRIASVGDGLRFSFERAPQYCFEENGRRLPFGCHAWKRWDSRFWAPFEQR